MKKLCALLFVLAATFQTYAQESAVLRINYTEGDVYEMKLVQNQKTGALGGTDMTIMMEMAVTEVEGDTIKTESKITSIGMDMNQGGMSMSYNSNQNDEELDATGKMLKAQLSPMMEAVIYNTMDVYGNTLKTKVEPAVPGMDQFNTGQNINYPKEEVTVGYTWTIDDETQGMKTKTTYKVVDIAGGIAYIDIEGDVSGMGTGSLSGKSQIDIETGMAKSAETEIKVAAQGVEVVIATLLTMTKK